MRVLVLARERDPCAIAVAHVVRTLLSHTLTELIPWERITAAELRRKFGEAGGAILLVGGSGSVPLLTELASAGLPLPKAIYAFGRDAVSLSTMHLVARWTGTRLVPTTEFSIATLLRICSNSTSEPLEDKVRLLINAHELKSRFLDLLTGASPYEVMFMELTHFLREHANDFVATDTIGKFYGKFCGLLGEAATLSQALEFDDAVVQETVRQFCSAMASLEMMQQVIQRNAAPLAIHSVAEAPAKRWPAAREASAQFEQVRLIPATILVVDDEDGFAARVRAYLDGRSENLKRFQLHVMTHTPRRDRAGRPLETRDMFRKRLLDRISCRTDELSDRALTKLAAVVYDYAMDDILPDSGADGRKPLTGIELAQDIARARPGVGAYLLTGKDILRVIQESNHTFDRVFSKDDELELEELHRAIVEELENRYQTPFWDSLVSFTKRPVVTMHAMAISHGRALKRSAVLDDVLSFYGDNYFLAETSATIEPLDSLLHPTGSILRAQQKAARAFGAKRTLFVTNGTTTANKIVLTTVLNPGDVVLVDRNCHISHHYGIGMLGARPIYLEPLHVDQYGISGGITLQKIAAALDGQLARAAKEPDEFPRALLLTNCTFDGVIGSPEQVIKTAKAAFDRAGVQERFCEIVFLFDEAWFAYARFHPLFAERTGMATAARLAESDPFYRSHLRVYATQSTHKTLSAFRQASMLHVWDPVLESDELLQDRLSQALQMHTTTSPHSGLVASLDLARRQVDLEGCALVDSAVRIARHFRADFAHLKNADSSTLSEGWRAVADEFSVLDERHLIPAGEDGEFQLDPTKITLSSRRYTGSELKRLLLQNFDIQVNKTSNNTVLMMINAGTTLTTAATIKNALYALAGDRTSSRSQLKSPTPIPVFSSFWVDPQQPTAGTRGDLGAFMRNEMRYRIVARPLPEAVGHVSAGFVVPYPPGYPVLVPGQIIDAGTVEFIQSLDTNEIHGLPAVRRCEVFRVWLFDVDGGTPFGC